MSEQSKQAQQLDAIALKADRFYQQAEQLREQENWEKAAEAYRRSIELYGNFSWSHHSLGNVLLKLEDWQGAVEAFEQAIALNPEFPWSHYSLGIAQAEQQNWAAALEAYQQARTLDPQMAPVGDKIVQALEQLIRENPREVPLYRELAEERIRLGKFEEAIAT